MTHEARAPEGRAGSARGENSGLIDLDRLLREAKNDAAPASVPAAPAIPAPAALTPAPQPVMTPPVVATPRAATPPAATSSVEIAAVAVATPSEARRSRRFGAAALVAVAVLAGVAVTARFVGRSSSVPLTANASAGLAPGRAITLPAPPARATSVTMPGAEPSLPNAADLPNVVSSATATRAATLSGAPIAIAPPAAEKRATVSLVDIPATATSGGAGDLGDAMKNAAGGSTPSSAQVAAPAQPSGAATLRPAAGALNAAIANAVRGARACLAADDAIVRATLTFEADGHSSAVVGRVSSSQPDAQGCVERALATARVDPFVEAPLAVPVVVRP